MGLFNFFSNKTSKIQVKDIVWKNRNAKFNGAKELITKYPGAFWFCWFSETQSDFKNFLQLNGINNIEVRSAKSSFQSVPESSIVIFVEHYPLPTVEEEFFAKLKNVELIILNSLDEPLFQQFGGERIVGLMEKLGMVDNESIEHSMISSSIKNAQQKIQAKVSLDFATNSASEWFKANLKSNEVF